ncbi:DUF423 domain-containing protein [Endozoicomonas sp. SCSIO W0465]|uniref:DUF423 domain-containing protein n=1 Tax=Endozoicomonas sp. SCSIO W0465 TaxID=2918516 RepID=UPI0020765DE4|nr:DUF423 domain-containing protein [Endozoicomonas sp. SCSIO W0465]USE36539.1 DUF423 domain-containing protein [Endozoicomonas sp. SCSIO W0465]
MNALFVGAIGGMTAVALSAFAAHGLKGVLSERAMAIFQTAADYQFYHSLALVFVALLGVNYPASKKLKWSVGLFTAGIVLFSGSLYLLSLTDIHWLGMVTPLGGVSFILGWLVVAIFAAGEFRR